MNLLPLVPEAAAATLGAIRPLSGWVREGAAKFADFLGDSARAPAEASDGPATSSLPFSIEAMQHRLADQIAQGNHGIQIGSTATSENSIGSPTRIEDLQAWAEDQLNSLHDRLAQKLQQAGIDLTERFELTIRPVDGSIAVDGDHPQRRAIEEALANDSELSHEIHQLIATLDLLRAAGRNPELGRAYEQDPRSAVGNHRALFAAPGHSLSRLLIDDTAIRLAG